MRQGHDCTAWKAKRAGLLRLSVRLILRPAAERVGPARPSPDPADRPPTSTFARARGGALRWSIGGRTPSRGRAGSAHGHIAPPPRARPGGRSSACPGPGVPAPIARSRLGARGGGSRGLLRSSLGARRSSCERRLQGEDLGGDVRVSVVAAHERGDALARHPDDRSDGLPFVGRRGELADAADGVAGLRSDHALVEVADGVSEHAGDDVAADLGPRRRSAACPRSASTAKSATLVSSADKVGNSVTAADAPAGDRRSARAGSR